MEKAQPRLRLFCRAEHQIPPLRFDRGDQSV